MDNKPHIKFEGHFEKLTYKYPKTVVITDKSIPLIRDRITHGNFLLDKVNQIKEYFDIEKLENSVLIQDNVVYIEFTSEWGYKLSFDSFDKSGFQLLNVKEEEREIEASVEFRYSLVVVVNEKAVNDFLKKINSYLNPLKDKKAKPANKNLLNNIQIIEIAT